jgi:two-component system nitrate/nitrite response regulator NarL
MTEKNSIEQKIRILIADDHPMMRMGICSVLAMHPRVEIVVEVSDGAEAIAKTKTLSPDIVVMDISLPTINGIDATIKIHCENPKTKVIIISMYDDKEYVAQFIQSGASAYVLKSNPPDELIRAIDAVYEGKAYFSPSISQMILGESKRVTTRSPNDLTEREQQVLVFIAEGFNSKQIADKLFISIRTVAKYRELIMKKLDLHSVAELTQYAISNSLIRLNKK